MSFSEPKWRERVQGMEDAKQIAKRKSGIRKISRSLHKCDDLQIQRLSSIEKQHQLKVAYQKEVAYRSTNNMLGKFRETFQVEKAEEAKKRPSDKNFQIRLYTKVDRDYWAYEQLRDWYNKQKDGAPPGSGGAGMPKLDSASAAFCVDNPNLTDSSSLFNKNSHYMLQCGGPHDPSGFLQNLGVDPGRKTVSMGHPAHSDSRVMEIAANRGLPQLSGRQGSPVQRIEAPHWGHWQKNLNYSAAKLGNMVDSGSLPLAAPEPWALWDKVTGGAIPRPDPATETQPR